MPIAISAGGISEIVERVELAAQVAEAAFDDFRRMHGWLKEDMDGAGPRFETGAKLLDSWTMVPEAIFILAICSPVCVCVLNTLGTMRGDRGVRRSRGG